MKILRGLLLYGMVWLLSGCAAGGTMHSPISVWSPPVFHEPGIYHPFRRGETVWSVSRRYQVPLDELVRVNRLDPSVRVTAGQNIFIPESLPRIKTAADMPESVNWPCRGPVLHYFQQPVQDIKNNGIDIGARAGSAVYAAADGTVIFTAEDFRGYGKTIIIAHPGGFSTVYAYNSENIVRNGQSVKKGQRIARVGSTGRADQSMLHFELRKDTRLQNPLWYLP